MKKIYKEALENSPVIAAVNNDDSLNKCLSCDSEIIFILYGDIISIPDIVDKIKGAGKLAFVHMDLIQGLSAKEAAVDYIAKYTKADGIISTKDLDMCTIMRFFLIDSMAFGNIEKQIRNVKPDVLEILPGPMPSVVARLKKKFSSPIIASGLIAEKEEVYALLDAGAQSISTTNQDVWFL